MSYQPLYVAKPETGLVQNRQEFILPNDAFPILQNAYVWREQIKRKRGFTLLGRLRKQVGTTDNNGGSGTITLNPFGQPITKGISSFSIGTDIFTDQGGAGTSTTMLTNSVSGSGIITYAGPTVQFNGSIPNTAIYYYPGLPVMGIRSRELINDAQDQTVFFDQQFAYIYNAGTPGFQEFIAGTAWNNKGAAVTATDFFWTTNYWTNGGTTTNLRKIFWVTNNTGSYGANLDPIKYTDGTSWANFQPVTTVAGGVYLFQCLAMLPFRGRLLAFNTWEGTSNTTLVNYFNRIRWSAIGTPFTALVPGLIISGVNPAAWYDDQRGQGGFLDIPTSEDIISVGFVRDNLVIYCERSTWQLRYTGRSIAPFQIEKVNSELGAESTFSAVQFDTSLVGIGDKGIVECDSFKSERIDIKIPDLVFEFQAANNGTARVHGVRDFINRLAYWTFPYAPSNGIFPDKRLVYNYENDSWAIFDDSFTTFGQFFTPSSRTWLNTHIPWIECNFPWKSQPAGDPIAIAGNQQGFILQLTEQTTNDVSLFIQNITGNDTTPTSIYCPNHNLQNSPNPYQTYYTVQISGISSSDPFVGLNGQVFGIVVVDANNLLLNLYNEENDSFDIPQLNSSGSVYEGLGFITVRNNFFIQSKKFNFADKGQSIQFGYIDLLMSATEQTNPGAIALNMYVDYNDDRATNAYPNNTKANQTTPDTFFNTIIPTSESALNNKGGTKFMQRVMCPTRGNFVTLEFDLNNAQMVGLEQEQDVQIDMMVLWMRPAGRLTQI